MVEEQCQQQGLSESSYTCDAVCPREKEEEITGLLTEESNGKEAGEEPQKPNTQATYNPLPGALYPEPLHTLLIPATQFTPEAPAPKAESIPSALPVQYSKKLVAFVKTFPTTSKKMAPADVAWHSGWFGCLFRFGTPEPRHF